MDTHFFSNKQKLCFTDNAKFTDFQGVGKDPLYLRYGSLDAILQREVDAAYRSFFAIPSYSSDEGGIYWFCDEWNERPRRYVSLSGEEKVFYDSVKEKTLAYYRQVLDKLKPVPERYRVLSAALKYVNDEFLYCYDGKVVLVAWGMDLSPIQNSDGLVVRECLEEERFSVRFDCGAFGRFKNGKEGLIRRKKGFELSKSDLPSVKSIQCDAGYVFKEWVPDPIGLVVTEDLCFSARYDKVQEEQPDDEAEVRLEEVPEKTRHRVVFSSGEEGRISGAEMMEVEDGHVLEVNEIPEVSAVPGKVFTGWQPDIQAPITQDTMFGAVYEDRTVRVRFVAGDSGVLSGCPDLQVPYGSVLNATQLPGVRAGKGYEFLGWGAAAKEPLYEDTTLYAEYKKEPWYKRLWAFLSEKGCFKWLLWLLGIVLLVLILLLLMRSCNSCSSEKKGDTKAPVDEVVPIRRDTLPDGRIIDDNGPVHGIVDGEGNLPDRIGVAPIVGDDGILPPIIDNPGLPSIIANRLNIYFEDDNVDMDRFARDFKRVYPDDAYRIIGGDRLVRMFTIEIPEKDRDKVREQINSKLPGYAFFVVDETLFETSGPETFSFQDARGWHLDAIHLREAWRVTRGNPEVVVAVVDDGFEPGHPMIEDCITKPYNVFTQNNHLAWGSGHGTHVAALAVGDDAYLKKGASGVAPECLLMPVQVFDNGCAPFSAVTNGIMYAIHEGADVVNISLGTPLDGLSQLPVEVQEQIARTRFKNEEKVWRKIVSLANERNCILVFAAGNNRILASIPPELRTGATLNVAAVGMDGAVTDFSNYGEGTNISAPGEAVYSAWPTEDFKSLDGTSMAAPIVAGTVALMKSLDSTLTISQIMACLQQTGEPVQGDIPVMVRVDRALGVVQSGNIPEVGAVEGNPGQLPGGGQPGNLPGDLPGGNLPGEGGKEKGPMPDQPGPGESLPGTGGNPGQGEDRPDRGQPDNGTPDLGNGNGEDSGESGGWDVERIRELIAHYKKIISELEKLLPENQKQEGNE